MVGRTFITDEKFIATGSLKFSNLLPLLKRIVLEMIAEFKSLLKGIYYFNVILNKMYP